MFVNIGAFIGFKLHELWQNDITDPYNDPM